ncbi:related to ribosomal protein L28 [Cephalotrichum gorgonifer]|uniref:Related to ribosomal protein L28 n=1 Tax=Cephalotrichum gorgonifer TaxID=2041049 RepID=A0AAE8MSY4_9PEZI|nr:related to ribosomal protein L28 [Cephalotrichum gorgonifer]
MSSSNVSSDLVWQVVRNQNSYLVKRKSNGSPQFSRDPLNLKNIHTRKYAGFVNDKAIGVTANGKRGVTVSSKIASNVNRPVRSLNTSNLGDNKSNRRAFKAVANLTSQSGYRIDLREAAVERVSAIRRSQRPVKAEPEAKLRGNKARQAAEASA